MRNLIRRDLRALVIIGICIAIWLATSAAADALDKPEPTEAYTVTEETPGTVYPTEDPEEPEMIEAALVEQGYFRDDIQLSYELQDYLHTACEEAGIPYELALAVIRRETDFRNITGDDGCSVGYMQIQARWHADRMDRLGVDDLSDPYGNFRVGCDFLAELLGKYDTLTDAALLRYAGAGGRLPELHAGEVQQLLREQLRTVEKE